MSDLPINNPWLPADQQDIDDLPLEDEDEIRVPLDKIAINFLNAALTEQIRIAKIKKNMTIESIRDTILELNKYKRFWKRISDDEAWETAQVIYNNLRIGGLL